MELRDVSSRFQKMAWFLVLMDGIYLFGFQRRLGIGVGSELGSFILGTPFDIACDTRRLAASIAIRFLISPETCIRILFFTLYLASSMW